MKKLIVLLYLLPTTIFASNFYTGSIDYKPKEKPHFISVEDEKHHLHKRTFLTLNTGFNGWGEIISEYVIESDYNFDYKQKTMPITSVAADYGVSRKFSFGISFGYQQTSINYKEKYFVSSTDYIINSYDYKAKRFLVAVRGDYYIFKNKKNFLLYFGFRIGQNFVTYKQNIQSVYNPDYFMPKNPPTLNAHVGASYYFKNNIGINTEIGLGVWGPYFGALGLTYRI